MSIIRIAVSKPIVLEILDIMEVGTSLQSIFDTICAYQSGSVKKGNKYKDIREERDKPCDFPRGMLKFVLSDGRQVVDGMEYRAIQEISLNTILGMKIQLSNVRVLRGVLLLDSSNTKVLGCGYDKIRNIEGLKRKVMTCLGMTVDPNSHLQPSSAPTSSPKQKSPVSRFEPTPPYSIPPSSTHDVDGSENSQSEFICIDDEDELTIRDWANFETDDSCFEPTPPSPILLSSTRDVDESESSQQAFIYIDDEDEWWGG
ncbi:2439_t:CDS:2 [Paraglomus brasilianum]|uniref:RecQ-mediated genome instability protein 1 n=1 Tax=Paraglomus brasilianum TaxID=144538 RepID=A0A9N8VT40_9GLOM|nr:2439_t:CDS:2 [Paraglomus brasilianum]